MTLEATVDILQSCERPTLRDLGGIHSVLSWGAELAPSIFADRLLGAFADSDGQAGAALPLVTRVLETNPYPLVVSHCARILGQLSFDHDNQQAIIDLLLRRATKRITPHEAELASECVASAFLLASEWNVGILSVLSHLEGTGADEQAVYVSRAARVLGLASSRGPYVNELKGILRRLSQSEESGTQAVLELAFIELDIALNASDQKALLEGLQTAATLFHRVCEEDVDADDARGFQNTLEAIWLFCNGRSHNSVEERIKVAIEAFGWRLTLLNHVSLRGWLKPRLDSEVRWYQFVQSFQGLASKLERPSWLDAVPTLRRLAALRRTMRSLGTAKGDQLLLSLNEKFLESFLAREGLRAHLIDWLEGDSVSITDRFEGEGILQLLQSPIKPEGALVFTAAQVSPFGTQIQQTTALSVMQEFVLSERWYIAKTTEDAFTRIDGLLSSHHDFEGQFASDVRILVVQLVEFLGECLDIGSKMGRPTYSFLFRPQGEANLPLEVELQAALLQWLHSQVAAPFPKHEIIPEPPDIASGRADIAIVRERWRIAMEVKRELQDASNIGLSKYLGQASSYQVTQPTISFLVVLDLCHQKDWTLTLEDNCWVEDVKSANDSRSRKVVVFRIPGNRPRPSETATPNFG